jgi:hypothetical protein
MKKNSFKKSNMEKMKCKMRNAITKGALLMEMAEDTMNIVAKAKIFKNMSNKK